jgi:DNA repair protein RAD50
LKDQLNSLQRDNDRASERRSNLKKQIDTKTSELKKIKDNIDEVCNGKDYKSFLASQKDSVAKTSMELAVLRSSENTYKDYISKIEDDPNCPVCHKNLEDHEGDELRIEMQEKIQELPKKIDNVEKKLKKEQSVYDKLNSYKSAYDSIERLNGEKSKMETELKELDEQIKGNSEKKEVLEAQLMDPEELLNLTNPTFIADSIKLDDLQRSIANKTKEVETITAKVPKNIPKISLDDAKEKRKNLNDAIKAKNDELKKIAQELKNYQDELNEAHTDVNNLNAQKNKFQEKVQGIERLKEQLKQLEADKAENERKLKESEVKLGPIKQQLNKAVEEKQKAKQKSAEKISNFQKELDSIKIEKASLERLIKDLEKYQQMNLPQQYENEQKKFKRTKEKISELQQKQEKLKKQLKDIEADIANEETTYRNIQDNIDLLNIEQAKQFYQKELSELEKKYGDADINKFKRDRQNVNSEIEKLNVEIGRLSGLLGANKAACEKIKNELNDRKYKKAAKNYLESVYEAFALQAAMEDLAKYRTALEKSLLKFHQDKMDQINQLLREYWNSIYQGNDIDYIMIKTDEEEEGAKAAASDKKRSYNYRVVQSKNGSEVDMRGRCSAGQKVLASLIIRMALADTFSMSCGILALDEPTTNLDSVNIRALCEALARIVQERDDGSGKFMLLVITHDEKFANALERADHFWKLSRDNRGFSRIERVSNY